MNYRYSGQLHVDFQLPDNIGTFEIRAFAMSDDNYFGSGTKDQVSTKVFSLQSSAPRVVRKGDRFLSGVSITVHDPTFDGDVFVEVSRVCQLLDMISEPSKV